MAALYISPISPLHLPYISPIPPLLSPRLLFGRGGPLLALLLSRLDRGRLSRERRLGG